MHDTVETPVAVDLIAEKLAEFVPKAHGWCSPEKAATLVSLVLEHKPRIIVEIGTFGGASALPMALAVKANGFGMVYGIDPWDNTAATEAMVEKANSDWWSKVNMAEVLEDCRSWIRKLELEDFVTLVQNKSENVVNNWMDGSIGLLHIDGNHSEELSYKDAILYLPKVVDGGIIVFDDVYWTEGGKPTTQKALKHLLPHCKKLTAIGECLILQKITNAHTGQLSTEGVPQHSINAY